MVTAAEYVGKLKTFCNVPTNPYLAEHSYGNMMHSDIVHKTAAHPVATKRIRAQTRLNEDIQTLEEAAHNAVVHKQRTCTQLDKDPVVYLSELNVK